MYKKLGFLISICLLAAGCNTGNSTKISGLEKENQDLKAQLAKQQASDFDLQAKCADQASKYFKLGGWDINKFDSYTNHWNKSQGKCFMLIQSNDASSKIILTSKELVDPVEGKSYGSFFVSRDKLLALQKPSYCAKFKDGNQSSLEVCYSETEFDDYTNSFMNN